MIGARDQNLAGFQRLAQRIERLLGELRQLVQKQHAMVGERYLAGLGAKAAAHKRGHRRGVMGRAERARPCEPAPFE